MGVGGDDQANSALIFSTCSTGRTVASEINFREYPIFNMCLAISVLASALRGTILQVEAANRNNEGKDAKMEALYQFLVGPEFRHRVEAIVENYGMLQQEIEKEKRAAQLRWSHQEKAIRAVIDNTIGMYGDVQGITSRALEPIKSLELDSGSEEDSRR